MGCSCFKRSFLWSCGWNKVESQFPLLSVLSDSFFLSFLPSFLPCSPFLVVVPAASKVKGRLFFPESAFRPAVCLFSAPAPTSVVASSREEISVFWMK